jgi:hypothetical protein
VEPEVYVVNTHVEHRCLETWQCFRPQSDTRKPRFGRPLCEGVNLLFEGIKLLALGKPKAAFTLDPSIKNDRRGELVTEFRF